MAPGVVEIGKRFALQPTRGGSNPANNGAKSQKKRSQAESQEDSLEVEVDVVASGGHTWIEARRSLPSAPSDTSLYSTVSYTVPVLYPSEPFANASYVHSDVSHASKKLDTEQLVRKPSVKHAAAGANLNSTEWVGSPGHMKGLYQQAVRFASPLWSSSIHPPVGEFTLLL
eukprot:1249691-Pyramimonas_sp.AAC.4